MSPFPSPTGQPQKLSTWSPGHPLPTPPLTTQPGPTMCQVFIQTTVDPWTMQGVSGPNPSTAESRGTTISVLGTKELVNGT